MQDNQGFTLIELAIVIVIIGLIIGGVMAGEALMRSAQIQNTVNDYNAWTTAVRTFQLKYNSIPGDMVNATDYWPQASSCPGTKNTSPTPTDMTCNGNGDEKIDNGSLTLNNETYLFWQHLANAGLIRGQYTGVAYSTRSTDTLDSVDSPNVPNSRIPGAHWNVIYVGLPSTNIIYAGNMFDGQDYGNVYRLGGGGSGWRQIIAPVDAHSVDIKMDDGKPGTGILTTIPWQADSKNVNLACTDTDIPDTAVYMMNNTNRDCTLVFKSGF